MALSFGQNPPNLWNSDLTDPNTLLMSSALFLDVERFKANRQGVQEG